MNQPIDGQFEAGRGHEIAKAVAEECITSADAHPDWPESWIAEAAADFVALRAEPAARQDKNFAVHRAARTVLRPCASTFVTFMILEGSTDDNSRPGLEAVAQSIGLIWAQLAALNRPWSLPHSRAVTKPLGGSGVAGLRKRVELGGEALTPLATSSPQPSSGSPQVLIRTSSLGCSTLKWA